MNTSETNKKGRIFVSSSSFYSIAVRNQFRSLITDKSGKMLIIPLACDFPETTAEREKMNTADAGFDKNNIYIFDEREPEKYKDIKFDYISVTGGNTFKLLYSVRKYGLDDFIRKQFESGADYFGFSAGAYLACPDIGYVRNFDDNNHISDDDFSALGLTEKYFLCHFDSRGDAERMMCRKYIGTDAELITVGETEVGII